MSVYVQKCVMTLSLNALRPKKDLQINVLKPFFIVQSVKCFITILVTLVVLHIPQPDTQTHSMRLIHTYHTHTHTLSLSCFH